MQAVPLCETFLPSPAPDFCPLLLWQGFGYCFNSNERSFVAVEQLFPKLEARCLPPLVISVGSFTSLYKSRCFCNTSSSLRTGTSDVTPQGGCPESCPTAWAPVGPPPRLAWVQHCPQHPAQVTAGPCQERSQACRVHPIPDTTAVLDEPSRPSALSEGQTPAFAAVLLFPHASSCPSGKAA